MAVALALLGAFGAAMDMDPPYENTSPYLWVAVAGVAATFVGCRLLYVGLVAKKQRQSPASC